MKNLNEVLNLTQTLDIDIRIEKTKNKEGLNLYYNNWKWRLEEMCKDYIAFKKQVLNLPTNYEFFYTTSIVENLTKDINNNINALIKEKLTQLLAEFKSYYSIQKMCQYNYTDLEKYIENNIFNTKTDEFLGTDNVYHDFIYNYFSITGDIENIAFVEITSGLPEKPIVEKNRVSFNFSGEQGYWGNVYYRDREHGRVFQTLSHFNGSPLGDTTNEFKEHIFSHVSSLHVHTGVYEINNDIVKYRCYKNGKVTVYFKDNSTALRYVEKYWK